MQFVCSLAGQTAFFPLTQCKKEKVVWPVRLVCVCDHDKFLYKCGGKLVDERTKAPSTSWTLLKPLLN